VGYDIEPLGGEFVEVECPKCATPVPYLAELAGHEIFCLGCGWHFVMPDLGPRPDASNPPFKVVSLKHNPPESGESDESDT